MSSGRTQTPRQTNIETSGIQSIEKFPLASYLLGMLKHGILNPQLLNLLARIRHTNTLVIADYAFPFWPEIETVDLALTKGIPTVQQVLDAILPVWTCGTIWMAEEFKVHNERKTIASFRKSCRQVSIQFEPHNNLKLRVPGAIGLIRTGDATIYSNMILESA